MSILGLESYQDDQFAKIANRHKDTHRFASIEDIADRGSMVLGKQLRREVIVTGYLFANKGSNEGTLSSSVMESFPSQPGGSVITVTNLAQRHLQSQLPFIDCSAYGRGNIVNGERLLLVGTLERGILHVKQISDGSSDPLATTAQKIKDWFLGF